MDPFKLKLKLADGSYFRHGLIYRFNGIGKNEAVCMYDVKRNISIEYYDASEYGKNPIDFYKFTKVLKTGKVFYRSGLIYKFCDSKQEFMENKEFLEDNPQVAPPLIFTDYDQYIIITKYMKGYKNLKEINTLSEQEERLKLQGAIVVALSKLGRLEFKRDLTNFGNIGYNGENVIFFEMSGELYVFKDLKSLILSFFGLLKDTENARFVKLLKIKGNKTETAITDEQIEKSQIFPPN